MYVRSTPGKPRKDGTRVEYVQLAHNVWNPERARSEVQVIHTFGRSDRLDAEAMRRLAGSLLRYLDQAPAGPPHDADSSAAVDGLRLLGSRPMGAAWLLDRLWSDLGLGAAIAKATRGRRLGAGLERVLFALVANRAIAPCSKLAALEWAAEDVHLPAMPDLGGDPQIAYRAMDTLLEYDTAIQEHVFFAVAGRLALECDVILFDTTSTYFETEDDDEFRRYGKSKDHRGDRSCSRSPTTRYPPPTPLACSRGRSMSSAASVTSNRSSRSARSTTANSSASKRTSRCVSWHWCWSGSPRTPPACAGRPSPVSWTGST